MTRTITPKQATFITSLAAQRHYDPTSGFAPIITAVLNGTAAADGVTTRQASTTIDYLLTCGSAPAPLAAPGYYLRDGDVFLVVANQAGDRTYAKRMSICDGRGRWVYAAGVGADIAREGLTPLSVDAAAALGHLHGVCVACGKALTDPKSVARGMGPVCSRRVAQSYANLTAMPAPGASDDTGLTDGNPDMSGLTEPTAADIDAITDYLLNTRDPRDHDNIPEEVLAYSQP